MIDLKVKKLNEDAIIPTYGSNKAACMDLYANNIIDGDWQKEGYIVHDNNKDYHYEYIDYVNIPVNGTVKIGTGIAMQPINYHENSGYVGLIFARSGLATKNNLRPANCVGVIDEDYTGEIIVALHNDDNSCQHTIDRGDRIAQIMWIPYEQCNIIEVDELDKTKRGDGGFGHTGK